MALRPNPRCSFYHTFSSCTVIWWWRLIWFLFRAPVQIPHELHCFICLESRSTDIFTQFHINYKQTLKKGFPTCSVASNGCLSWDKSPGHKRTGGPERNPFISSFTCTYLYLRDWRRGGGGVCVWNRPPSQFVLESGNQGNRRLQHFLFWLLANHLKSIQLVILCM